MTDQEIVRALSEPPYARAEAALEQIRGWLKGFSNIDVLQKIGLEEKDLIGLVWIRIKDRYKTGEVQSLRRYFRRTANSVLISIMRSPSFRLGKNTSPITNLTSSDTEG